MKRLVVAVAVLVGLVIVVGIFIASIGHAGAAPP